MIQDIEKFKKEMLEWGYQEDVDYKIIVNTESSITLELINIDPMEEIVTIHETIHNCDPNSIYDLKFLKMVVKWVKEDD
ncbi:MAG: hypothetical protein ACTSPB_01220 [Candidatus Thorarchaeota archaeon]